MKRNSQQSFQHMRYLAYSTGQTRKIGEVFAKNIEKTVLPENKALIIGLKGALGGGKTTFLQGFAKGLKIKERVLSPTFVIMRKFKIQNLNIFII